jgi:hypothetical protein
MKTYVSNMRNKSFKIGLLKLLKMVRKVAQFIGLALKSYWTQYKPIK